MNASNDTERNWGAEKGREPDLDEGDTLIFSECGRVLDNICYRSHYFRLVQSKHGEVSLLVKHGGGQERIREFALRKSVQGLLAMDSDSRYLMLYALYQMYTEGGRKAAEKTAQHYRLAFIEGRLKKRKVRAGIKFWIEHQHIPEREAVS